MSLDEARGAYAQEIASRANIRSQRLISALAKVPRERFLGSGPWYIAEPGAGAQTVHYRWTDDADPSRIYRDVGVAVDAARNLYNGNPSILISWLDAAEIREGEHVFHLGCGVGYYTAIVAEIVGPAGHVTGIEVDREVAARAKENLAYLENVDVVTGDGGEYDPGPSDVMVIHAGVTHPRSVWLDRLRPGGRLLLPLTFELPRTNLGKGVVLLVRHEGDSFPVSLLPQPIVIFSCTSVRDSNLNDSLLNAFRSYAILSVRSLRRDVHQPEATCSLHADEFCFSTKPAP